MRSEARSRSGRRVHGAGPAALLALFLAPAAHAVGPTVTVTLDGYGSWIFGPGSPPVQVAVAQFAPLWFSWAAEPGAVDAYRYGWNIRNPANDDEWEQSWCTGCLQAPPRIFASGTHRFFLEARNAAGETTLASLELPVQPLAVQSTSWTAAKRSYER